MYDVAGNNIYPMGIFTSALVQKNLVVNPRRSYKMYESDLIPAGIRLDGPMNLVLKNRIGGAQYNGIWGEFTRKKDGYRDCPWGLPFVVFSGNTVHSARNGIYFTQISSRSASCQNINLRRPSSVVTFLTTFSNLNIYRNRVTGLFIRNAGYFALYGSAFADNKVGAWIRFASLAK